MITKKIIMSVIVCIVILSVILILRVVYINKSYKNVYKQRHHFLYQDLIDNSTLKDVENYVLENLDRLLISNLHKDKLQRVTINLDSIKDIKSVNFLVTRGFKTLTIEKHTNNLMRIELEKQFLTYQNIPTYHSISYFSDTSKAKKTYYKNIAKSDNWYFWSYDATEHGNDNFLEMGWLTRYNEAQAFFKTKNKAL